MVLLEQIHERTGYRTDVLEKDYYVVLMLHELAKKQKAGLPAYYQYLKEHNDEFVEKIEAKVKQRLLTHFFGRDKEISDEVREQVRKHHR